MTGCLTRFFPPSLHRFIFSFRSFGIVSHLHKFQNHESYSNSTDTEERRERERERRIKKMVSFVHGWESWRRIVSTHAKVGATQLGMQMFRQRGRNTFRADEMQTLARCGWSLR